MPRHAGRQQLLSRAGRTIALPMRTSTTLYRMWARPASTMPTSGLHAGWWMMRLRRLFLAIMTPSVRRPSDTASSPTSRPMMTVTAHLTSV